MSTPSLEIKTGKLTLTRQNKSPQSANGLFLARSIITSSNNRRKQEKQKLDGLRRVKISARHY
jgi:hypothetical protein